MHRNLVAVLLISLALSLSAAAIGAPLNPPGAGKPTNPQILSVTPGNGSPGDTIVMKAINVPSDKTKAEVWFTIAANKPAQGTIMNTAVDGQGAVTYWVQVPGDDTLTAAYRGPLYIKNKDTGRVTPNVQFNTIPILPKITSHSPQYGVPGKTTTFKGVNFKPTDEVSLSAVGAVPLTFKSATEIAIALPTNWPTTEKFIKVTVRRKGSSTTQVPPAYTYALDPKLYTGENKNQGNTGQKVEPKEEGGQK